jgi:hypothetical protein
VKNQKQTIKKIVSFLNNPEEEGGFWLPNIQRAFVWSEERICRLFDSILREYPISTLLIWKTTSKIRRRKFIDNWKPGLRLTDFYVPENDKKKCMVLDGQQRLQSLFIGLEGSYDGRELYLDILSGELAAPDDVKYKFAFLDKSNAIFPWVKFKDLATASKSNRLLAQDIEVQVGRPLTDPEKEKIGEHLEIVARTFRMEETVSYQELDSIDNPALYTEDDVVEVFIRANSGGTPLGKSDLLFSLLNAAWDQADVHMDDLLDDLNCHGFAFTRDFILKTCLTLLDQGARYEVEKFRKPKVRDDIEQKWDDIAKAVRDVLDFIRGKTFIQCDKAIPSYLALIPLVYVRYHFKDAWSQAKERDGFLLRSLLTGAFSGTPDQLIDDCVAKIKVIKGFDVTELFGVIRTKNRSLELTENRFWEMGYGSDTIHLLFNLWYQFNYTPAYENNLPQVDHIFPQSLLKQVKIANPETGKRNLDKYRIAERNQLANCMLLTQQENGTGGKGDTPPDEWFAGKPASYLEMHLIPPDPALWKLERFEDFIRERKKLILARFSHLIVAQAPVATPAASPGIKPVVADGSENAGGKQQPAYIVPLPDRFPFWDAVAEDFSKLNLQGFAVSKSRRDQYLQVHFRGDHMHYEWIVYKRDGYLGVSLHFESDAMETNLRRLQLIKAREESIRADIGHEFIAEPWGRRWARAEFRLPFQGRYPSPDLSSEAAGLMKILIERTYPFISQGG